MANEETAAAAEKGRSGDSQKNVKNKGKDKGKGKSEPEDEKMVLTPSETALGIKINQPKRKTVDAMTRLYAVPSEKLRVWSSWLTKVGERSQDWQWWLRAQIGLAQRISDRLQRAAAALEIENKKNELGQGDETKDSAEGGFPEGDERVHENSEDRPMSPANFSEEENEEEENEDQMESEIISSEPSPAQAAAAGGEQQPVGVAEDEGEEIEGDKRAGKKGKKISKESSKKKDKLEPKIVYKEGFWPVGIRWKPLSLRKTERKSTPKRRPDKIPVPESEERMEELIKEIRHQGVIYRSLYKHWSETGEQAVKHIVGRTVLHTKDVPSNGDDIPYIFYLEPSEPDVEYAVEHDDENVLLADTRREKITKDFTHLYFNLSDKPGKGGKPWI